MPDEPIDIQRWIKVSAGGCVLAGLAWYAGEAVTGRIPKTRTIYIVLRVAIAGLGGLGEGFFLIFSLTLVTGILYWLLNRGRGR